MDINRIGPNASQIQRIAATQAQSAGAKVSLGAQESTDAGKSFGQTLSDMVSSVNDAQHVADAAVQDLADGKTDSLHEVMLAMGKAELSFKFLMQTRNKLLDAYNDIVRMQV